MTLQPRSGSLAGRILTALQDTPEGASDGELALHLGKRPQAVNKVCHDLEVQGALLRERHGGTIINRLVLGALEMSVPPPLPMERPWFWEGNVQDRVAAFLVKEGWTLVTIVDTASKEPGTDIVVERGGIPLWVTVKGLPRRTENTQPYTQARHYFAGALLDIVLWHQEAPRPAQFAVALRTSGWRNAHDGSKSPRHLTFYGSTRVARCAVMLASHPRRNVAERGPK